MDLLKPVPQHYCSLVMFREVFLRTKFTEKRESEREILRMHEFCVTRNVLLRMERRETRLQGGVDSISQLTIEKAGAVCYDKKD